MTTVAQITPEFAAKHPKALELVKKLEAKGIRFEINKKTNKFGDKLDDFELGINTYKWIWSWFTLMTVNDKEYADFRGSYSMNTGKTNKGVRRQVKVITELHRQLEIVAENSYDLI